MFAYCVRRFVGFEARMSHWRRIFIWMKVAFVRKETNGVLYNKYLLMLFEYSHFNRLKLKIQNRWSEVFSSGNVYYEKSWSTKLKLQ